MGSQTFPSGIGTGKLIQSSTQSVYELSATKQYPLGTRMVVGMSEFAYAKANAALTLGKAITAVPLRNHMDATVTAAGIGATSLTITNNTSTTVAADDYAGGAVVISLSTGIGQMHYIKGNTGAINGAAMTVTLCDQLTTAIATTSEFNMIRNPYMNCIVGSAVNQYCLGTTLVDTTAYATTPYFWLLTRGLGPAYVATNLGDATAERSLSMHTDATLIAGATANQIVAEIICPNQATVGAEPEIVRWICGIV